MSSLKELQRIFDQMEKVWERGEEAALLMVYEVRGSSYRRPGAKIMIASDGEVFGSLSGGCLESDLLEWAKLAINENRPMIRSYNLSENDLWGLGIGCKGSQNILILPIKKDSTFWKEVRNETTKGEMVTLLLNPSSGEGWLLNYHHQVLTKSGDYLPSEVINELFFQKKQYIHSAKVIKRLESQFIVDPIFPLEKLVVAGAGHDAVPVVELAIKANFDVTVLDSRSQFNNENRFPGAHNWAVDSEDLEEVPSSLRNSWWIIMNHHLERDRAALELALESNPKYVGVLGPIQRTEELLVSSDISITDNRIYAPIGLDLGGDTIEEVALSIVSELLSVRNRKNSNHLRGKSKIHT
ncbi:xanthine and CO dehydrogenases maturation factor, XdhC/CoxF family [Mycobacteroides abscessus subsp. abscessus]|nr:xanthine and CO dehydrogenases maturation factor, XdhC/CoxF family [Mycobacteroides abscessus subsp. abscessus]